MPRIALVPIVLALAGFSARAQGPEPASNAPKPPPMARTERFGVNLQGPRYNPLGPLGPNILFDGARDAHNLGFRTLKIAMHSQVVNPDWRFYNLTTEQIASAHALADIARLDVFRRTLALPFRTFVITADALGEGQVWNSIATPGERGRIRPQDQPLSDAARSNIYWQLHDLARHLLDTYKGTGKVFILQSPEMDWRILPYTDESLEPSDVALQNAIDYSALRQRAVEDARAEAKAEGVYVYNCVEVNLVRKALTGRRTIANVVLPRVDADLVGYSAYDTAALAGGTFAQAVGYLRSIARPSAAFGRNQVFISEIGAHERKVDDVAPTLRSMLIATTLGVPWVVQWTLYDNEALRVVNGRREVVYNAVESDLTGLWVRKPDGSLGRLFRAYRPYLLYDPGGPEPTDASAYVARAYRLLLGRDPDPAGAAAMIRAFEETPWDKERVVRGLLLSAEYRDRSADSSAAFVFDAYRALLGRDPDPEPSVVALLRRDFAGDADRLGYLDAAQRSDEARRRYVDWVFRLRQGRSPAPSEAAPWLDLLARGGDRRQVYDGVK
jgi:hypothetical protein